MFREDLEQFFDLNDFAVVAVFTRANNTVATAHVLFDDPSHAVGLDGTQVEEASHTLCATAVSVADVRRKDRVAVAGGAYLVESIKSAGGGLKLMTLAEA